MLFSLDKPAGLALPLTFAGWITARIPLHAHLPSGGHLVTLVLSCFSPEWHFCVPQRKELMGGCRSRDPLLGGLAFQGSYKAPSHRPWQVFAPQEEVHQREIEGRGKKRKPLWVFFFLSFFYWIACCTCKTRMTPSGVFL